MSSKFFEGVKKAGKEFGHHTKKRAITGIAGITKTLANAYFKMVPDESKAFRYIEKMRLIF